jgi:hypothetical protein
MDESSDPYDPSDGGVDDMGGTWVEGGIVAKDVDTDRFKFHHDSVWTQHLIAIFSDLERLVQTQGWPLMDHPNARVTFLRLFMAM